MRPKIVALVIAIAFVTIAGLSLLRNRQTHSNSSPANDPAELARKPGAQALTASSQTNASFSRADDGADPHAAPQPADPNSKVAAKPFSSAGGLSREEYVEQRVGELMDLGMSDDPETLKTLLSEINNPEGEIRKAAIEAVKQFGSTDAIPKLEEALSSADPADKQDIRDAIEFLKLPSFLAKRN